MKQSLEFILPTRDATVGHWRFNGDLTDQSGNDLDLEASSPAATVWSAGYSERGITAVTFLDGERAVRAGSITTELDFDVSDFTIEVIASCTNASAGSFVTKYDDGASAGWAMSTAGGKVIVAVGDGTSSDLAISDSDINDGKFHHIAAVCNRGAGHLRIYVDGTEDVNSPVDISAITGNISAPSHILAVGEDIVGGIDEICISSEVITAADIAFRVAGRFNEFAHSERRLIRRNIRNIDESNDHLDRFLAPLDQLFGKSYDEAFDLAHLLRWDQCPSRFLAHLGANFGLELIDAPYATEAERRHAIENIVWIYQRRGTVAGIEKFIELLGFTPTVTESFSVNIPFVTNQHSAASLDAATTTILEDDFSASNLAAWDYPLSINSWWRVQAGKMRGTGDGQDNPRNALIRDESSELFYMEMEFELTIGTVIQHSIGMYLAWEDDDNWLRVSLFTDLSNVDFLRLTRRQDAAEVYIDLVNITNIVDHGDGPHKFWVHRWTDDKYTIGIDDITLVNKYAIPGTPIDIAFTKKGIWLNRGYSADFTSFLVRTMDRPRMARLLDPAFLKRKIQISLTGSPLYQAAKEKYLERVMPNYVPVGVDIEWL